MSRIQEIFKQIEQNYQNRKEGRYNAIPFSIKKMNKVLPGIVPGLHYLITAGTKVGKSKYVRQEFIMHPYLFSQKTGYPVELFYFPLEDSVEKVGRIFICYQMLLEYGIEMTPEMLNSFSEECFLNDDILEKIKAILPKVEEMTRHIKMSDSVRTPSGMYNMILRELLKSENGEIEYFPQANPDDPRIAKRYIKKNDRHWILVVDNLNNIVAEQKHAGIRDAIDEWTEIYVRQMLCNFFGVTVINVQQQAPGNEAKQYTNQGNLIWEKLVPSIEGLGENKMTSQTAHVIIGLFSPYRHNLTTCPGIPYRLGTLKDFYRLIRVIATNIGESPVDINAFFDGLTEDFRQLPDTHNAQELEKLYEYVKQTEHRRGVVGSTHSDLFGAFGQLL